MDEQAQRFIQEILIEFIASGVCLAALQVLASLMGEEGGSFFTVGIFVTIIAFLVSLFIEGRVRSLAVIISIVFIGTLIDLIVVVGFPLPTLQYPLGSTWTPSPILTPTFTPSPTWTTGPTSTPTFTLSPTLPPDTPTPTITPSPTSTSTPSPTSTSTPSPTPTFTPAPTPTLIPPAVRAITTGSFQGRRGLWILREKESKPRFLPFEEFGKPMPSWESVRYWCDLGQEVLAMASSDWEEGVVAILSDEDLCVIGKYLWDVPTSTILPSQRQVQAMAVWDSLVLIGTDFGLFYYDLTDQTRGEVSFTGDQTLVPYSVTALDVYPEGICLGAVHYLATSPRWAWYSQDGLNWTPLGFAESLPTSVVDVWCGGPNQSLAVLQDGRWSSLGIALPSNPVALGQVSEVAFSPEGTPFVVLIRDQDPFIFLGSSKGWRSLPSPSPCEQPISLTVGEIEGGPVPVVACAEGIYYREVWEAEGIWQSVVLPE